MKDSSRTNQELLDENSALKQKIQELAHTESDRKRAEEVLRESEERYRSLVDNASDIVFRTDETGHFTFVNPVGIRIMGYEEEEIIGRHYPTLIRPDMREEVIRFFGIQFVKRLQNTYSEYPVITKEGGEIWFGQNTRLIMQDGHIEGFQAIARDITARKRVEEELRRNQDVAERLTQEMAIIAEIGKVVGSTLDTEEIYERFAAEVRKLIPFDRLAVNLHDLDQGAVSTVYASGEYIAGRQPGDSFPLKGSVSEVVVRTRVGMFSHPLSAEEMEKQFPGHSATIQAGMRSLLCVPLISRDKVIASLHFRSKKPNAYTDRDLRLAEGIGSQIAGAIASAQLYAGLKKTEQKLKESEQRYRELSIKLQDAYLWMRQKKDKIEARKYIESIIFLTADDGRICGFTEEAAGMTKKSHSDLQGCNIQDILVFQEGQTFMDLIHKVRPRMAYLTTLRFKNQIEDGPSYEAKLTCMIVEGKKLFYIVLY
jgi:PAS domain S-box-containing protein